MYALAKCNIIITVFFFNYYYTHRLPPKFKAPCTRAHVCEETLVSSTAGCAYVGARMSRGGSPKSRHVPSRLDFLIPLRSSGPAPSNCLSQWRGDAVNPWRRGAARQLPLRNSEEKEAAAAVASRLTSPLPLRR